MSQVDTKKAHPRQQGQCSTSGLLKGGGVRAHLRKNKETVWSWVRGAEGG